MSLSLSVSESLKRLEAGVETHTGCVESLKQYTTTIQRLTNECTQRIRSMGRTVAEHYLKQWFRNFLATMDECHLLQTGEIRRRFQLEEHRDHLHDRGNEKQYYKIHQLSMVSVDGLNYEYRSLYARAKTKTRDRMDDVVNSQLAVLETAIQKCKKDLDNVATRMEKALRDVGAVADISSQPMLEFVSVYWSNDDDECLDLMGGDGEFVQPDVRFRLDRNHVSNKNGDGHVEVRADSMSTTLDEVENCHSLGSITSNTTGNTTGNSNGVVGIKEGLQTQKGAGVGQRAGRSRRVVDDSDDEEDAIENIKNSKKRNEDDFDPLAGGKSVNVSMIQRKLGFNPDQINRSLERLEKEDQHGDRGVDHEVEIEEDFFEFGDNNGVVESDDNAMEVELSNDKIDNERDIETCQKDKEIEKDKLKEVEVKMDMKRWMKLQEKNGIVLAFEDRDLFQSHNSNGFSNGLPLRSRNLLLRVRPSPSMIESLPPKLRAKGRLDLFMNPKWRQSWNDSDVDELISITLSINSLLDQLCLELWTAIPPVPLLPQSLVLHPADPTAFKKEFTRGEFMNLYSKTHKHGKNGEQYDVDGSLLGPDSRVNTVVKCCEGEEGKLIMQCLLGAIEAQRLCSCALIHVPFIRALLIACITHHRKNKNKDNAGGLEEVLLPITECNNKNSYLENCSSISWDLHGQAPAAAALLMKAGFPLYRIILNGAQVEGSLLGALLACGCTHMEAVGCGLQLEHVREALIGLAATKYNHIHLNRANNNSSNSSDTVNVNVLLDFSFNALFCRRTTSDHMTEWTTICQTILSLVLPHFPCRSQSVTESDEKLESPPSRVKFQIILNLSHCAGTRTEMQLLCKGLMNAISSSSSSSSATPTDITAEASITPVLKVILVGITTAFVSTETESREREGMNMDMDSDMDMSLLREMQLLATTRNIEIIV